MNSADIITMLGNLGQSMQSVAYLIGGLSYLCGIMAIFIGLMKLKKNVDSGGRGEEGHSVGFTFIIGGVVLFFLPTAYKTLSESTFGTHNVLQYTNYNPWSIYDSIGILLQTAGLFWFVRGCIIIMQSSKPGAQEGHKGFFYLCAGVLALNFTLTTGAIDYFINWLVSTSFTFKKYTGL